MAMITLHANVEKPIFVTDAQFRALMELAEKNPGLIQVTSDHEPKIPSGKHAIRDLELPVKVEYNLHSFGIFTVEDLLRCCVMSEDEQHLYYRKKGSNEKIPSIGKLSISILNQIFTEKGLGTIPKDSCTGSSHRFG